MRKVQGSHDHTQGVKFIKARRVSKACNRCRIKKSRCSGSFPCFSCKERDALCTFGCLEKSKREVFPERYVGNLQPQEHKLVAGLQTMYNMLLGMGAWPGPKLAEYTGGPRVHDILDTLGMGRDDEDCELVSSQHSAASTEESSSSENLRYPSPTTISLIETTDSSRKASVAQRPATRARIEQTQFYPKPDPFSEPPYNSEPPPQSSSYRVSGYPRTIYNVHSSAAAAQPGARDMAWYTTHYPAQWKHTIHPAVQRAQQARYPVNTQDAAIAKFHSTLTRTDSLGPLVVDSDPYLGV